MNTNTWRACFWTLCYILTDSALFTTIRDEVRPAVESTTSAADLGMRIKSCTKLHSVLRESLRLSATTLSNRTAMSRQTLPSGKTLAADTDVMVLYHEMMRDPDVFGDGTDDFRWDRFYDNGKLATVPEFRPFGGGVGQCPGRFLAQTEIMVLIALLITKYDLEAWGMGCKFPEMDLVTPPVGLTAPKAGQDMWVRVTLREEEGRDRDEKVVGRDVACG